MLSTEQFGLELNNLGFDFFSGVPCSFLKNLINYAINSCEYIAAVNEGDAVAIAAGAFLGGRRPVVLMQNSGLCNAISPLTSLTYVFRIPLLGFVSLRGEPGLPDEPQHEIMGRITTGMLDLMEIGWEYLSPDIEEARQQLDRADSAIRRNKTFFFVVRKGVFDKTVLLKQGESLAGNQLKQIRTRVPALPRRSDVLRTLNKIRDGKTAFLAATGYTGRELYTIEDAVTNIYMVGSMGCVGSLGLGLALAGNDKYVIAIDGDGALLMRMGSMAAIAERGPKNLLHLVLDNQVYESTGGQATASRGVDFVELAAASGYERAVYLHDLADLDECMKAWRKDPALTMAYIRISEGVAPDLSRPVISPEEVKERFMMAWQ